MLLDAEVARMVVVVVLANIVITLLLAVGSYGLARRLLDLTHFLGEKFLFRAKPGLPTSPPPPDNPTV